MGFTVIATKATSNWPYGVGPHHFDTPPYTYTVDGTGGLKILNNGVLSFFLKPGYWQPPVVDDP